MSQSYPVLPRVKTTRVGNIGAGQQTLLSITIPPNTLRKDGDMLRVTAVAIIAANANVKTTKLFFGVQNVNGRSAADNNSVHFMIAYITRLSQTDQQGTGLTTNLSSGATTILNRDTIANDCANPIEVKITGEGVADNDIVSRLLQIEYLPSGSNFSY